MTRIQFAECIASVSHDLRTWSYLMMTCTMSRRLHHGLQIGWHQRHQRHHITRNFFIYVKKRGTNWSHTLGVQTWEHLTFLLHGACLSWTPMAYFRQILTPNSPIRNHLYPSSNFCFLPIYCQGESRCFSLPCASRLKQGLRSEGGRTHRFDWAKWGRGRDPLNQKHRFKPTGRLTRSQWRIAPISSEKRPGKGVLRRPS